MTVIERMNLERFAAIVEAYGAEPRAWPEAERDAALALCAQDADARALREEAHVLDAILAKAESPQSDTQLESRIMADFQKSRRGRSIAPSHRWIGMGAIAASLVVGVTASWIALRPSSGVDLSDPAAWEVLGDDLEFAAKTEQ